MDVMKTEAPPSLNLSVVAELSFSPCQEDISAVGVDCSLASHMPGEDDAVPDCTTIKKQLTDDMAKNGISSHFLSPDHLCSSKQCTSSEAMTVNHRMVGSCSPDSRSRLDDPNGPLVQPRDCTEGCNKSCVSGVEILPVSVSVDEQDCAAEEDVKQNCPDVMPSCTDVQSCPVISSDTFGSCNTETSTLPSVAVPIIDYADNLFDASIIAPISSFESDIAVTGSVDDMLSAGFPSLPLENHDVCQSVMMTEVLNMKKNLDGFTSLQMRASSAPNSLVNCRAFDAVERLDLCLDDSVKLDHTQSKYRGLLSDSCESLMPVQIPNGVSCSIYSSKTNVSPAIVCADVGVTVASDSLLALNQNGSSDLMIQGVSADHAVGVAFLAESKSPTCDVPVSFLTIGGIAAVGIDSVDCSTINSEGNAHTPASFQVAACKEANLSSILNTELSSELMAKSQDGLGSLAASQLRTPRARKSCGHRPKEMRPASDSNLASLPASEARDEDCAVASMAVMTDAAPARTTLSNMTIKLPELENVLGIGYKSLDKMDAKTLDRIVLARAQKKARLEAESGRSKVPIKSDGPDRFSCSNSILERSMHDYTSKGREIVKEAGKRMASVTDEMPGNRCAKPAMGHGDNLPNGLGPCDIKAASKENKCISVKTEASVMNSDHGYGKGLWEKCENSATQMRMKHENKESSMSGHMTSYSPPVTVANGMIFKARKSQGYAFGRVKRVRDILNSPELSRPASMTKTNIDKSCDSSNFAMQDKTRKGATSPHLFAKPRNRTSQSLADITGNLSENERKQSQAEVKSPGVKRKPNGRFCSPFGPDGHPSKSKRQKLMSHSGESYLASTAKSGLKREMGDGCNFQKHESLERSSLSSSSSADNFSVKLPRRPANKISYPVTPPRSPETAANQSSDELSTHVNGYLKLHCCCRQSITLNLENVATCQALDSMDGKIIGCTRRWTNRKVVRPSTRIPFMAMCDKHVELLSNHQCCPGCGQFCVQGEFYQCKQSSAGEVHTFHRRCLAFNEKGYVCPHCGAESVQQSVVLQATEQHSSSQDASKLVSRLPRNARLGFSATRRQKKDGSVCSASNSISSATSKNSQPDESKSRGINRKELEASIAALTALGKEKQKKIRPCAKSFYAACKNGELDRVLYMIDEGIDPNLRPDDYSESSLHIAVRHGQKEVVKLLLQAGALPNSLDLSLYTPIMVAAISGRLALLEILVGAGGSLHYRAISIAPLQVHYSSEALPTTALILCWDNTSKHFRQLRVKDLLKAVDGMTVLHLAAKSGQLDVVRFLLENYHMDVNIKDDGGWTPVIWATEYKHITTVKYLLKMGANPNIQDKELNTGLHWAAYAGCCRTAEMFLNSGCDLECANEHGDRPLHIAARQDHYEFVSFLLMRGVDPVALNKANMTPAECCPEKSTSCRAVLLINERIKRAAALRPNRPERLVHHDVSLGREFNPITIVNGVDNLGVPEDFTYVADYVETNTININRVITSLRMCNCVEGGSGKEECSTINCNCMRSSIKSWYDKEGRLIEEFNYHDPPLIFECNRACRCHTNCQNRVIQQGIMCRLQVFRTHHRGWGCRTLLNIPRGSFVCEYFGELISDAEADRRQDDSYLFDLDNQDTETFCVDAAKFGNVSRFINHLCEPNLTPVKVFVDHQDLRFPRMCFFANRDIRANEELGFDYGDKFWVIKYKDFTCDCGSAKCRYSVNTIGQTLEDFKRRQEEESGHASRT